MFYQKAARLARAQIVQRGLFFGAAPEHLGDRAVTTIKRSAATSLPGASRSAAHSSLEGAKPRVGAACHEFVEQDASEDHHEVQDQKLDRQRPKRQTGEDRGDSRGRGERLAK